MQKLFATANFRAVTKVTIFLDKVPTVTYYSISACFLEVEMIMLGLISWVIGIGLLCWVFFTLVSVVVPTMAGVIVFFWAYRSGAGLASVFVGIMAGTLVLWLFRKVLMASRQPFLRLALVLAFCIPAVIAGYSAALGFAALGNASSLWQHVLAVIGAGIVGAASFARLMPSGQHEGETFLYSHE
ncbi:hypothetical protein JUN65_04310 [Gluconacetobacter azotocaptans]|uniref:hypothetical protein n=1 Tax=Gluconacetobacter azotocaptans TaxID=142834 RepID=UPI00195D3AAB|nr:hypothetical protein [Gluconacetobacter azotocaptans]MBM9400805.1 hypothetical protein [Gluconacetobacter azotocaptans]